MNTVVQESDPFEAITVYMTGKGTALNDGWVKQTMWVCALEILGAVKGKKKRFR